eukprot:739118-Pyramimonas_sp.AAC.1
MCIRDRHPEGLPHLKDKDRAKLAESNRLAQRALALLQLAAQRNIPGGEENPESSFLWLLRSRQKFAERFKTVD